MLLSSIYEPYSWKSVRLRYKFTSMAYEMNQTQIKKYNV